MAISILHILIGLVVGVMVGLTGVGGGVILLPIMIFGLGVPALVAVGSDAAFSAITKAGAGFLYWREGKVNWKLVGALACGSLPGAWLGVTVLDHLSRVLGPEIDHWLTLFIGVLLVGIGMLLFFEEKITRRRLVRRIHPSDGMGRAVWIGLFSGVLIGLSSVGSGSVVIVLLLLMFGSSPQELVGTDIMHAIIVTGFAGLLQFRLGNIDTSLVLALAVGSIPGAFIGVKLSSWLPASWLRRFLCSALLLTGARTLMP